MVRLLSLILLLLPLTSIASPQLDLVFEQKTQQLGWAFNARVIASGTNENLSNINLSPLEEDFGVIVKEYSSAASQQELQIELYPRRTGNIKVPELSFSSMSSKSKYIEVLPARNASGPIDFEYQLSSAQVWQRQQVRVNIKVTTQDKFARIEALSMPGTTSDTRHIPASKQVVNNTSLLETGWVIFPWQAGQQIISLPAVLYHLQGRVERRFYLPHLRLNVKPLPSYIPPLMPVGKVYVDSSIDSRTPLRTGETYNWKLRLSSPVLLAHFLPPVLRQISPDDNINYLPAQSERQELISPHESQAEVLHTIPFQSLVTGPVKFPALRIQYFDPVQGRIAVAEFNPPRVWSIADYWLLLIGTVLLFFCTVITRFMWKNWLRIHEQRRGMAEAMHRIEEATTVMQLRHALHLIARAEHWPDNLSINKWNKCWDQNYSPSITPSMIKLSSACYTGRESDINTLKEELLKLISNRKPNRRLLFLIGG